MSSKSISVSIAEIMSELKYISQKLDEKCKIYDKHLEEAPDFRERILKIEHNETSCKFNLNKDIKLVSDKIDGILKRDKWNTVLIAAGGGVIAISGKEGVAWIFQLIAKHFA